MRLYLIRHGETHWNKEERVQGKSDIALTDLGRQQAACLAEVLSHENIAAVYSSPMIRAVETASTIARPHGLEVRQECALLELDEGELDGLTYQEMRERYRDFLIEWRDRAANLPLPGGGESLQQCQERAWGFVRALRERHPDEAVVAVSHNFTILCIICRAIRLDLSDFRRLRQDVAAMSVLDFGEWGPALVAFNDTCHWRRDSRCARA
jgi:broad specificity phosphatase PhoE